VKLDYMLAAYARLAAKARLALPQLQGRIAAAPEGPAAAQLSPAAFLDAAAALVSPTGQLGITAATPAASIPALKKAPGLDGDYLAVVAAVRPALAEPAYPCSLQYSLSPWLPRRLP
jgi:hypothetical protein